MIKLVVDIRRLYNDYFPLPIIIGKPFIHRCAVDEIETPLFPFSCQQLSFDFHRHFQIVVGGCRLLTIVREEAPPASCSDRWRSVVAQHHGILIFDKKPLYKHNNRHINKIVMYYSGKSYYIPYFFATCVLNAFCREKIRILTTVLYVIILISTALI